MDLLKDWRFLIFVYIILAGVWGVVQKVASAELNVMTLSFVSFLSAAFVVTLLTFKGVELYSTKGVLTAVIGGVLGGIATIAFYGALKNAPVSLVVPLSSMSILVTVILAHFVLKESISLRHFAGIALGTVAIILLSK